MPVINLDILKQRGVSLISLMVGLLLAMISILAGMMLYKNIVHTTVQTRSDALQDGQLASAMLSLQLELQNAGYGLVKNPANTHVALNAASTALYWRFKVNNAFQCKGFRIHDSQDGKRRQLQLLKIGTGTCTEVNVLGTLDWVEENTIAEFRQSVATAVNLPAITIALNSATCFPYGMGTKDTHPMVTITAENAAITAAKTADAAATGPNEPFRYDFCLPNL